MIHGDGSPLTFQTAQSLITDAARSRMLSSRAFMPTPHARAIFVPTEALTPRTRTPEPTTFVPLPRGRFDEPFPEPVRAPRGGTTEQPGTQRPLPSPVLPIFQGFGQDVDITQVAPAKETNLRPLLIGGGIVVGLIALVLVIAR